MISTINYVLPSYVLVPEKAFPGSFDDCYTVATHILGNAEKYSLSPQKITIMGTQMLYNYLYDPPLPSPPLPSPPLPSPPLPSPPLPSPPLPSPPLPSPPLPSPPLPSPPLPSPPLPSHPIPLHYKRRKCRW